MAVGHPLPPEGVDLRAELADHQRSRVEQALARAQGDLNAAAKLLRVTALDVARMQAGHIAAAGAKQAQKRGPAQPTEVKLGEISRIERGVEVISAAVIRRLHAEGRSSVQIARRLGCNHMTVEKVLRMETERAVRELHADGVTPSEIVTRLRVTPAFVTRALQLGLAKCEPLPEEREGA